MGAVDEGHELGSAAGGDDARRPPVRNDPMDPTNPERIAAAVRQYEVERFYYDEAALLDAQARS